MRPAARVQAAIEILDEIVAGAPAERALTGWARRSRFAGSKDRAAIRDHVYDVLRQRQSCAAVGGALSGRAFMVGLLSLQDVDLEGVFTGDPYAPGALSPDEMPRALPQDVFDLPSWSHAELRRTLGDEFEPVAAALRDRAPTILRANLRKTTRDAVRQTLELDGIATEPHPHSATALIVTEGARKIAQSDAYKSGLVELQDASSQAAIEALPLKDGMRVLDYCAGGGGKLLAMAGRIEGQFFAHDAHVQRLKDLPERAKRAGVSAKILTTQELPGHAPFDLVFCDVPCSGSGSWRRDPEGKWRMNAQGFQELLALQNNILTEAAALVAPQGHVIYATCSMCHSENAGQIEQFTQLNPHWQVVAQQQLTPLQGFDGFYYAHMMRI